MEIKLEVGCDSLRDVLSGKTSVECCRRNVEFEAFLSCDTAGRNLPAMALHVPLWSVDKWVRLADQDSIEISYVGYILGFVLS